MPNPMRKLRLWLLVMLLSLSGLVVFFSPINVHEWVFVYYMSYDNDLNPYGKVILRDLKNGVVNSKIAVVVQADFTDNKGMKRIAMYHANGKTHKKEIILKSEDSADEVELKKYLGWVCKKYPAKNYAIIFLDHGGRLNQMCLDEKPFKNHNENKRFGSGKWLHASEAGKIVANFNQKVDGKVRLLFLQQCGRAVIQNLYNFVGAAEYIMASPVKVDAPNTYYTKTLASVAQDPNITGEILSKIIMKEDEHYTVYSLISNKELKILPGKLKPVLQSFGLVASLNRPKSCSHLFEFDGEKFYDLKFYFQSLNSSNNNIAGNELNRFFDWYENHLVVSKALRKPKSPDEFFYSGLSIFVPSSQNDIAVYSFLPLYQQTSLERTMKLMFK